MRSDEVKNALAWATVRHYDGEQDTDAEVFGVLLTYIVELEEKVATAYKDGYSDSQFDYSSKQR